MIPAQRAQGTAQAVLAERFACAGDPTAGTSFNGPIVLLPKIRVAELCGP